MLLLAWANLGQNRRRTAVALAGLTFAVLLVFLQLGLLAAVRRATTQLYECFEFDVALVSRNYRDLEETGAFDRVRLQQAGVLPGVAEVLPVGVAVVAWTDPATLGRAAVQLVGVPVRPEFVRHAELRARLGALAGGQAVLLDRVARRTIDAPAEGDYVILNEQRLRLAGRYRLGTALAAEGGAFIEHEAWQRVTGRTGREINFGFVRTQPGADPAAVARELRGALPDDVLVFTRAELVRREQDYFTRVKPLGAVFQLGAAVGCLAAGVMLFQVLATDVNRRLREYATLKAMGFGPAFVAGVGLWQAALCLAASTAAAAALAEGIFFAVRRWAAVPAALDLPLAATVAALAAGGGVVATGLALVRLRRAAPAELFH